MIFLREQLVAGHRCRNLENSLLEMYNNLKWIFALNLTFKFEIRLFISNATWNFSIWQLFAEDDPSIFIFDVQVSHTTFKFWIWHATFVIRVSHWMQLSSWISSVSDSTLNPLVSCNTRHQVERGLAVFHVHPLLPSKCIHFVSDSKMHFRWLALKNVRLLHPSLKFRKNIF